MIDSEPVSNDDLADGGIAVKFVEQVAGESALFTPAKVPSRGPGLAPPLLCSDASTTASEPEAQGTTGNLRAFAQNSNRTVS